MARKKGRRKSVRKKEAPIKVRWTERDVYEGCGRTMVSIGIRRLMRLDKECGDCSMPPDEVDSLVHLVVEGFRMLSRSGGCL